MPSCGRCRQDDKPCFYAKSRRGMRDKNALRRRCPAKEQTRGRSAGIDQGEYSTSVGSLAGNSSGESWSGAVSDASPSPGSSSSRFNSVKPVDPRRSIDLYYKSVKTSFISVDWH